MSAEEQIQLNERLEKVIRDVADEEGYVDYKIDVKSGSMKGDGYMGVIYTVKISEKNKKDLNLIIKYAHQNDSLRKQAPVSLAYAREIFMYDQVFPTYFKFQKDKGIKNPFTSIAKCYKTLFVDKDEALVFENLKEIGYKLWNRKVPMNERHVQMVFKEYAKLHALSFALHDQEPETFSKLTHGMTDIFSDFLADSNISASFVQTFRKCERVFDPIKDKKELDIFNKFVDNILDWLKSISEEKNDRAVVVHGDCWCNNMMFKYEDKNDEEKPTKICFLDWQIARVSSPILDLAYFLYACSPKYIYDDIEKYLHIYHDSLSDFLARLGSDVNKLYPFQVFKEDWKKYCRYGLIMSMMVIRVMLSEVEEAPDLSLAADNGKNLGEVFNYESIHEEKYNARVRDIIMHMIKNKFI